MFCARAPATLIMLVMLALIAGSASACAGASSGPSPLTYEEGKKRETEDLRAFPVTLVDSRESISALALMEPKVSADPEGGTKLAIRYAKDEPELQCLVAPRFITAGSLLRSVASTLLSSAKPKGYVVHVGGTPKAPSIWMNMLLEMPEDGRAVLVEWKVALAYSATSTVLCQTATVGYDGTIHRIFDKLAQTSFARATDNPVYADLGVAKKGDFVVGFEWTRAYAEAKELRTVVYTSVFGMGTDGFLGVDQLIAETSNDKGELLLHVDASDSRTVAQTLTLRAEGKAGTSRGATFELDTGEDAMHGKVGALPTSFLQVASTLRRMTKGEPKPVVIRRTDVGAGGSGGSVVRIQDVSVTREGASSVILAERDGHARCEVDEDGRCTKFSKGSITIERLARYGQFPKVP